MNEEIKIITDKLEKMDAKITSIQLTLENELRLVKERIESIA